MAQLLGVLEQGLIYAVLALGVYITFKILDFPDMTVDSTFPLGAAVTALMISNGIHPLSSWSTKDACTWFTAYFRYVWRNSISSASYRVGCCNNIIDGRFRNFIIPLYYR